MLDLTVCLDSGLAKLCERIYPVKYSMEASASIKSVNISSPVHNVCTPSFPYAKQMDETCFHSTGNAIFC